MKYLVYLFCFFIFAMPVVRAQNFTALKAGAGISSFKYKYADGYQAHFSWYAGFMAHFELQEQFFIRTELLYSLRGYHVPASPTSKEGNVGFSYLSVPLLAGYMPVKKLSVMVGPELGYLLSARSKDEDNTRDITGFVNNRFSVDANAGLSLELTPELLIETHFLLGLTPLYKVAYTDVQGTLINNARDGFNRVWQVGFVYKISGH